MRTSILACLSVLTVGAAIFACGHSSAPEGPGIATSSPTDPAVAPLEMRVVSTPQLTDPHRGAHIHEASPRRGGLTAESRPAGYANGALVPRSTPTGFAPLGPDWYATYGVSGDAVSSDSVANPLGGPVVQNANIQLVFWGSAWLTSNPTASQVSSTMQRLVSSTYLSGLAQYGYQSGSVRGMTVITSPPPANFLFQDIGDELWQLINGGVFPDVDDSGGQIVYMFFTGPGVAASGNPGAHGDYSNGDLLDPERAWVSYTDFGTIDYMTDIASHELVETITDPYPNSRPAWIMDRSLNGGIEIGDACRNTADYVDGIFVDAYFSQLQRSCVIPFLAPPLVTGLSAISGSNAGGGTITVTGMNFDAVGGTTSFTFGSAAATHVSCSSASSCTMTYPAGNGIVDVLAQVNDFTSAAVTADQFYYSPSVLGVTPSAASPGDTVTVSGVNLAAGTTTIAFGGVPATNVSCGANTLVASCTATVPGGAGAVHVVATVNGQPSDQTSADVFSYGPVTVTGLDRNSGYIGGGTLVGITGTGFEPCPPNTTPTNMRVYFAGVQAVASCWTATEVIAYSPPMGLAGPVDVTVTAYGSASAHTAADVFTYTALPEVVDFSNAWSGKSLTGTIAMNGNLSAGTVITLTSSQPSAVLPPAQVTIPAGQAGVSFPIATPAFDASSPPTITAIYDGQSYSMVVSAPPRVCMLTHCPLGSSLDEGLCECIRCRGTTCQ